MSVTRQFRGSNLSQNQPTISSSPAIILVVLQCLQKETVHEHEPPPQCKNEGTPEDNGYKFIHGFQSLEPTVSQPLKPSVPSIISV